VRVVSPDSYRVRAESGTVGRLKCY